MILILFMVQYKLIYIKNMIRKFKLGDIVTYCGDVGIISEVRGIHPANGIPLYDFTYDGGKLSNNLLSTFFRY